MTTLAPTIEGRFRGFGPLVRWRRRGRPEAREDRGAESRARCAFVQETLARNPDAFASELDVQMMMQMFPGRF